MTVPQYNLSKSTIPRRKGTSFRPPLSFRGAKLRGNLLGHCANSNCLPGDCHAALRLAMTTGIRGWCLRIRPSLLPKESAFWPAALAVPYISISKYSVGNGHRAVPYMDTQKIPRFLGNGGFFQQIQIRSYRSVAVRIFFARSAVAKPGLARHVQLAVVRVPGWFMRPSAPISR